MPILQHVFHVSNKFNAIIFFGGIYGLAVMLTVSTRTTSKNIDKIQYGQSTLALDQT